MADAALNLTLQTVACKVGSVAEDWMRVADYIKKERRKRGYGSQAELAAAAGVATRTIQSLEAGNPVRNDTVAAIELLFRLAPGSIRAIREGREPVQLAEPHSAASGLPTAAGDAGVPARWIYEDSLSKIAARAEEVADVWGKEMGDDFMQRVLQLREQAQRAHESEPDPTNDADHKAG